MRFTLQMLRTLIADHPDRAAPLTRHVEALEKAIDAEPELCLHRVRALFESVHATIAPQLGIDLSDVIEFPTRNSRIIKAMDFSVRNHPDADKINGIIGKLLGSINGAAAALAELSNIPNLRHGGSLDWGTLERRHAIMLGGMCDTLVSFLFEVAWGPGVERRLDQPHRHQLITKNSAHSTLTSTRYTNRLRLGLRRFKRAKFSLHSTELLT